MDKNSDYGNFPPYIDIGFDPRMNDIYGKDPVFSPMMQYEQAYMYYRYLTCQMEYKIKCKEYEKLCKSEGKSERRIVE